jgi:hypothetical protein
MRLPTQDNGSREFSVVHGSEMKGDTIPLQVRNRIISGIGIKGNE